MNIATYCDIMNKIRKGNSEGVVIFHLSNNAKYACPIENVEGVWGRGTEYIILPTDEGTSFVNMSDIVAILI